MILHMTQTVLKNKILQLRGDITALIRRKAKIGPDYHESVERAIMWYAAYLLASAYDEASTKDLARSLFCSKIGIATYADAVEQIDGEIEGSCASQEEESMWRWDTEMADEMFKHAAEFWGA